MRQAQCLVGFAAALLLASSAVGQSQDSETQGSSLRIAAGKVRADVVGAFQVDARSPEGSLTDNDASALDIARKRVGVHGTVGKIVAFQVEAELDANHPWRDVFVGYRQSDAFKVQAGQFKLPFSLDQNTRATQLDFAYRSRVATHLAPGRDRGVMLHGRLWPLALKYEAGIFLHDGEKVGPQMPERATTNRTAAMRVTFVPFAPSKSSLTDLQAAVAFTRGGVSTGVSDLRGRRAFGELFFPSTYHWVSGMRRRTGLEIRWRPGPFSAAAEYIRVTDERRGQAVSGGDLLPLLGQGWYLSGTWAITGDSKARGLGQPRSSLFQGGMGALELAARIERLGFGSTGNDGPASADSRADHVAARSNRVMTLGINWYVNRFVKIQGNAIRETLDTAWPVTLEPGRSRSWGRIVRLQLSL